MVIGLNRQEASKQRNLTYLQYVQAGCYSGIATRVLIQPLDVVKIRFQLQEEPLYGASQGKYSGSMFKSLAMIWREEGFSALWRGHVPAQFLSIIYGVVQYYTFEMLSNQFILHGYGHYTKSADFLCGSVAGCMATTFSMPFDVIRTRMVVSQGYRNLWHPFHKTWQKEGLTGFFRGLTPSLAQIALNTGIKFTAYNYLNSTWNERRRKENEQEKEGGEAATSGLEQLISRLMSGALAGIVAKSITYPLDLVRHRLQINERIRPGAFGQTTVYGGMFATIRGIFRHEGFLSFYKGLWPAVLKESSQTALSFFFYELACDWLSGTGIWTEIMVSKRKD